MILVVQSCEHKRVHADDIILHYMGLYGFGLILNRLTLQFL